MFRKGRKFYPASIHSYRDNPAYFIPEATGSVVTFFISFNAILGAYNKAESALTPYMDLLSQISLWPFTLLDPFPDVSCLSSDNLAPVANGIFSGVQLAI